MTLRDIKQTHPRITVLIPTFNRAQYLIQCLDSIFAQTLPPAQIIVVNDGSTDNTKSVCDAYQGKIEYFENGQQGRPGAMNLGLKKVTSEYVWIFDDDDVALPDALERLVKPLEENSEYGFSFSTFFYTAEDETTRQIGSVLYELKIPDLKTKGFLIPLLEWNFLGGAGLFARTSCYKEVGDFDLELLRSADYEMAIRLARRFKGIFVLDGPTFHYRQHRGLRGPSHDRFPEKLLLQKWFSYNQRFFRKFYNEIPLGEYLPPGVGISGKTRQALLQRLAIMSYKLLIPEVLKDLRELAILSDQTPFSKEEYQIIREMITRSPYSEIGTIFDHLEFFDEIRRLAASSAVIRLLRAKVFRAILARYRSHPSLNRFPETFYRSIRLYF